MVFSVRNRTKRYGYAITPQCTISNPTTLMRDDDNENHWVKSFWNHGPFSVDVVKMMSRFARKRALGEPLEKELNVCVT